MRLTPKERRAIFAGTFPTLTCKPDQAPDPDTVIELSALVRLIVKRTHRIKADRVRVDYIVQDERARLLRASPPAHDFRHDELDRRRGPDEEAIERAAEESSYTHSQAKALPGEPEAVTRKEQEAMTTEGRKRWAEHRQGTSSPEERRRQERAVRDRLRQTLKGLDPVAQAALLASIEREIQQAHTRAA